MANEQHLKILEQGVEAWNQWREENPDIRPDLNGADLRRADLRRTNLSAVDLRGADLSNANLNGADLSGADLGKANLSRTYFLGAYLRRTNLSEANLRWANLNGADLSDAEFSETNLNNTDLSRANLSRVILVGARLIGSDLSEANLSNATVRHAIFANIDLSVGTVKGLETVLHWGPSTIAIDTISRSQGKISEAFLRGCGLSDIQIEMAKLHNPDLTSEQVTDITYRIHELYLAGAVHYYSCFISYSGKDDEFAKRLYADLQSDGVRCWFAPEDMKIGDEIRPRIDQSIRMHDKLLVVLSEHSIGSDWVEDEVETALEEERKQKKTMLFPIRLDDAVMETDEAWAAKIRRTRYIGEFCHWKDHDSYREAFDRLLRDLKAEEG
jgi:uncharacterized protein YjbI with pentapeptide repeats